MLFTIQTTVVNRLSFNVIFFSSRRRHTRSLCDWSSDVCSSDLAHEHAGGNWVLTGGGGYALVQVVPRAWTHLLAEIGRASCRERVSFLVCNTAAEEEEVTAVRVSLAENR